MWGQLEHEHGPRRINAALGKLGRYGWGAPAGQSQRSSPSLFCAKRSRW